MNQSPSELKIQATIVAMTLDALAARGLTVDEIKRLFEPHVIEGWFSIKAKNTQAPWTA